MSILCYYQSNTELILPWRAGRSAFSALQLQPVLTCCAVQTRHATLASVQARDANRSRGLYHRVVRVVALGHATFTLKKQRVWAGYAMILCRAGAGLARRMAGLALTFLVILARIAIAATLGSAQALFVQAPTLDTAGATQCAAGRTAGWTCHTFASLLVRAITCRT